MIENWLTFVENHLEEFTIQYPPRREYFKENFLSQLVNGLFTSCEEILLYLHIPFCEAKCFYCNFAVDVRSDNKIFEEYTEALLKEIDRNYYLFDVSKQITGIDIGGGTPTRLPTPLLLKILQKIYPLKATSHHPFSISIETTPKIASEEPEKMQAIQEAGIDRISMGIQSFNETHLNLVNRELQISKNEEAIYNLRQAGFQRVNTDLIFGLPQQTLKDWEDDLIEILKLSPDSITTYDCLYRGKGRALTKRTDTLPSQKLYGEMYDLAYNLLISHGYYADYGSVNFSKNNSESGTSAYFEGRLLNGKSYLGLGNYATSMVNNYWYFNTYNVSTYIQNIKNNLQVIGDFYKLPSREIYAKYILYSLNFGFVDEQRFFQKFQCSLWDIFQEELTFAIEKGWIYKENEKWKINKYQFCNISYIRSLFYSPQAQKWLMSFTI